MQSQKTYTIEIVVNGQLRQVPEGQALSGILELLGVDQSRIAVELNRSIVRRAAWGDVTVGPGATLEIVQFVGGG